MNTPTTLPERLRARPKANGVARYQWASTLGEARVWKWPAGSDKPIPARITTKRVLAAYLHHFGKDTRRTGIVSVGALKHGVAYPTRPTTERRIP